MINTFPLLLSVVLLWDDVASATCPRQDAIFIDYEP